MGEPLQHVLLFLTPSLSSFLLPCSKHLPGLQKADRGAPEGKSLGRHFRTRILLHELPPARARGTGQLQLEGVRRQGRHFAHTTLSEDRAQVWVPLLASKGRDGGETPGRIPEDSPTWRCSHDGKSPRGARELEKEGMVLQRGTVFSLKEKQRC